MDAEPFSGGAFCPQATPPTFPADVNNAALNAVDAAIPTNRDAPRPIFVRLTPTLPFSPPRFDFRFIVSSPLFLASVAADLRSVNNFRF